MVGRTDDNQGPILDEALTRFVDAYVRGERPDIDEFASQYTKYEVQIRQRLRNLREIETLFDSLVHADESDFEGALSGHDLVGQKLGNFQIEEVIGRGGMGVVYLACDTKLDRHVAIKCMPVESLGNPTARARFQREAKLLASLNHPNIAVIHDVLEHNDRTVYLVLEYVPGETLAARIARGPIPLEEALSIGQQVAEAISAAHEKNVVHRDLKPGNIKITPDHRVKVLDFGLAKAPASEGKNSDITATGPDRLIGTPAYMSPEQVRGGPVDHRTDIWSFGCIFYEMLTGRHPFEGETVSDTMARTLEREPDWGSLPSQTPGNLRGLIRRCLEKDPQKRLQQMGNAVADMRLTRPSTATGARPWRSMAVGLAAVLVVAFTLFVLSLWHEASGPVIGEKRLVVLPFENLGPPEDEDLADGLTSTITARLAGIHGLAPISYHTAMRYNSEGKTTREIGKELRVDYILEGTIQYEQPSGATRQLRIIPQLVRASDDRPIWADTYDSNLTGVFRVQSDLSERVAQALGITLLEPERQALHVQPTDNPEAHEYYLRGIAYLERGCFDEENRRIAVRMFQKAVEWDPRFASAYACLAQSHLMLYWYRNDRSPPRLAMAEQAMDKLLELDPDGPETHLTLGTYQYWGRLEYDRALEEFAIVRKSAPHDGLLLAFIGAVKRRQGKLEEALADFKEAYKLDPRSPLSVLVLGQTCALLRDYPQAEHYCSRVITLNPELVLPYGHMIRVLLSWKGKTERARAVIDQALENVDINDDDFLAHQAVLLEIYDGNYQKAQEMLSDDSSEFFDTEQYSVPKALLRAQVSGLMGDREGELAHYDSARLTLEAKIQEQPQDPQFHSALGIAYAGLGRKTDAIREGQFAVELLPVAKEAWGGLFLVENLARIYAMVDEHDLAIDQIMRLLRIPGELSVPLLRIDPVWDPLRDHLRFRALVEKEQ